MNERTTLARRNLLRGSLVAATGAAVLGRSPASAAAARADRTQTITLDVACRADTMRVIPAPDPTLDPDSPLYGAHFLVEGYIFDAGTIPEGAGWDHTSVPAVGTWLCGGSLIIRDDRAEPHVMSSQQHHLAPIGDRSVHDQLFAQGVEGFEGTGWSVVHAVTGGTGRFSGARGEVVQHHIGTNVSSAGPAGAVMAAGPNFRFEFHLL